MYNIGTAIVVLSLISTALIWGSWELIDWLWIDDSIRSSTPISPEIELIIEDNIVDTVYVYHQP